MKNRFFAGLVCQISLMAAFLLAAGFTPAFADTFDDLLKETDVELDLGAGQARGRVLGREGDVLKMALRDVEFTVPVSQLSQPAANYYERARELADEGSFRRAGIRYALGRLLDQQLVDPQLEKRILEGLEAEKSALEDFRSERLAAQERAIEHSALGGLAKAYPALNAILMTNQVLLPDGPAAPSAILDQWQTALLRNNENWRRFRDIRDSSLGVSTQLNQLRSLVRSMPKLEAIRADLDSDMKRLDAIIHLFVYADANLWIDRLEYRNTQENFEEFQASYTPEIEKAREKARELLLEQLVPSQRIERFRRGNLYQERVVPIQRNQALVEEVQPRVNAPIIRERRTDSGIYFVTSMGDEIFVPVSDWEKFDTPRQIQASPTEAFLASERPGLENFREGLRELTLAWSASPGDIDRVMALRILQQEAVGIYGSPKPVRDEFAEEAQEAVAGQTLDD